MNNIFYPDYDSIQNGIIFAQVRAHQIAKRSGFWDKPPEIGTSIALMHSELSEALEVARKDPNTMSTKVPKISALAEELADCMIRILDFAKAHKINMGEAVVRKMIYNSTREYKHGKKF